MRTIALSLAVALILGGAVPARSAKAAVSPTTAH